jgi:hypothetical protein
MRYVESSGNHNASPEPQLYDRGFPLCDDIGMADPAGRLRVDARGNSAAATLMRLNYECEE